MVKIYAGYIREAVFTDRGWDVVGTAQFNLRPEETYLHMDLPPEMPGLREVFSYCNVGLIKPVSDGLTVFSVTDKSFRVSTGDVFTPRLNSILIRSIAVITDADYEYVGARGLWVRKKAWSAK